MTTKIHVQNNTDHDVWFGAYNLNDGDYIATLMTAGLRGKIPKNHTLHTTILDRERIQVVFWDGWGPLAKMLAKPDTVFANNIAIAKDENDHYVYNHHGEPEDKRQNRSHCCLDARKSFIR